MSDPFANLTKARAHLEGWRIKLESPKFHGPTMRFEHDRAWDKWEAARQAAVRADPQRYAESHPHEIALYVEFMPDTEARRSECFACETDADLFALIQSWRPN